MMRKTALRHTPLPDFQTLLWRAFIRLNMTITTSFGIKCCINNNSVLLQGMFALHYIIIWNKIWLLLLVLWSCREFAQGKMLTLCMLGNFSCFIVICWLYSNLTFSKKYFRNTTGVKQLVHTRDRHRYDVYTPDQFINLQCWMLQTVEDVKLW